MKIIFMGTPDFSAVVLEKLNKVYPVDAVVTGIDKVANRGHKIVFCPLKQKAIQLGIDVLQFNKVSKEGIEKISQYSPDIIVTAAFGQILSDEFLKIPKHGVLNVHASLLPKYRGSSPIQSAILNGEVETGVTIMRTVHDVDAGDILLKKTVKIGENENAGMLFDRLAEIGGEAIVDAIKMIENGSAIFEKQNEKDATHCNMLSKNDGNIDFSKTAEELDFFVRAMTPWPSAFTHYNGKTIKVLEVQKVETNQNNIAKFGEILQADNKNGILVACKNGAVRLKTIQPENSKPMDGKVFMNGHQMEIHSELK